VRFCPRCGIALAGRAFGTAAPAPRRSRRRSWTPEAWRRFAPVLWLYAALLGISVAGAVAGGFVSAPLALLAASAAGAALVLLCAVLARREVGPLLRPAPLLRARVLIAIPLFAALATMLHLYVAALAGLGFEVPSLSAVFSDAGWPRWSVFVLGAVVPGVVEEIGLRGFVQTRLGESLGARGALFAQAALFAFLHLLPASFPSHFLLGLGLGWLRLVTGSLYPGMAVHAALNALAFLREGPAG
jgi:membrane protease YdiL (CAAX protease family)